MLALVANHYFGPAGGLILAATVTLACLKTAVGLITSCAETFSGLFPRAAGYRVFATAFCVVSFLIANLGLNSVIAYSLPVLMFLYPLAITLILLALCGNLFGQDRRVYGWVTGCTMVAAIFDLIKALPAQLIAQLHLEGLIDFAAEWLPLFSKGMGWVVPALIGLVIGLALHRLRPEDKRAKAV